MLPRCLLLAFVLRLAANSAVGQISTIEPVVRLGAISGENGEFGFSDRLITVYSRGDISVQLGDSVSEKMLRWKGHFSFQVVRNALRPSTRSVPLASSDQFAFCDPFNQVDLSARLDHDLRSLLPRNAEVKTVDEMGSGRIIVVYALGGTTVAYSTWIAVFQPDRNSRESLSRAMLVSRDGNYCGMRSLGPRYRAILIDEPSGSSDFSVVYVFALRP